MNKVADPDLFSELVSTATTVDLSGLIDFDADDAERERQTALRRQRRTAALMEPFNNICRRLEAVVRDVSPSIDANYLMIKFMDFVSERMVGSSNLLVPKSEIVAEMMQSVSDMDAGVEADRRSHIADKIIDLMVNREEGGRRFEVAQFCPVEKVQVAQKFEYMAIEKPDGEPCYRLTDDGMKVTLRVLNTDSEVGGVSSDLLKRAFDRKNIGQIVLNVNKYKADCERYIVMIKTRLRDIQVGSFVEWTHIDEALVEALDMSSLRSKEVADISSSIDRMMEEGTFPQEQLEALMRAKRTIHSLEVSFSKLNTDVFKAHDLYKTGILSGVGRYGLSSLMPNLHDEILVPMMGLPLSDPDGFCETVGRALAPPSMSVRFLDLRSLFDDLANMREELSRVPDEVSSGEDEDPFDPPKGMSLKERMKARAMLRSIVRKHGPISLSDLCRRVWEADLPKDVRVTMLVDAITASKPYGAKPLGSAFELPGLLSGDDVEIEIEE